MRIIVTGEVYRGLSVTIVSPAKSAEPIDMSLGMWTRVGPRNCRRNHSHRDYSSDQFL